MQAKPLPLTLRKLPEFVFVSLFDDLDCLFMTPDLLTTLTPAEAFEQEKPYLVALPLIGLIQNQMRQYFWGIKN